MDWEEDIQDGFDKKHLAAVERVDSIRVKNNTVNSFNGQSE